MTDGLPDRPGQGRVQQSFRRGLQSYHAAAVAQAQIAARLMVELQAAGAPGQFARALEFGCGTGHLTAALLQRFAVDDLTLNDLVPDSAAAIQPILAGYKTRTTFVAGGIETLALPDGLDLITSASTLQWVAEPADVVGTLVRHLAPQGWLAISGFGRGHFAELRPFGEMAMAPGYLDPDEMAALLPGGMQIKHLSMQTLQLSFASGLDLLRHLRLTGVNARAHQHWTKADLRAFEPKLRAGQAVDAPLRLGYQPVFLVAQKTG